MLFIHLCFIAMFVIYNAHCFEACSVGVFFFFLVFHLCNFLNLKNSDLHFGKCCKDRKAARELGALQNGDFSKCVRAGIRYNIY